jgi:hypothetical protein
LNKTHFIQAAKGDTSIPRRGHQRTGRPSQTDILGQRAQATQFGGHIEGLRAQTGHADLAGRVQAGASQFLFLELDSHVTPAGLFNPTDRAETNWHTHQCLQLESDVPQRF